MEKRESSISEGFGKSNTEREDHIQLPPSFRFHPTDEELITHYHSNKFLDARFKSLAIGEADLNTCKPWDLPRSKEASKLEEVKRLAGGKIKKKEKQEVVIEKIVRNKRKYVTVVKGLDLFGVKLSDASKKLGKKFATGASVVKGPTDKEQIDVQGDISFDIVEFITETWSEVPESAIFFIEDGRKIAAA